MNFHFQTLKNVFGIPFSQRKLYFNNSLRHLSQKRVQCHSLAFSFHFLVLDIHCYANRAPPPPPSRTVFLKEGRKEGRKEGMVQLTLGKNASVHEFLFFWYFLWDVKQVITGHLQSKDHGKSKAPLFSSKEQISVRKVFRGHVGRAASINSGQPWPTSFVYNPLAFFENANCSV